MLIAQTPTLPGNHHHDKRFLEVRLSLTWWVHVGYAVYRENGRVSTQASIPMVHAPAVTCSYPMASFNLTTKPSECLRTQRLKRVSVVALLLASLRALLHGYATLLEYSALGCFSAAPAPHTHTRLETIPVDVRPRSLG
jgi:hypothetical protein